MLILSLEVIRAVGWVEYGDLPCKTQLLCFEKVSWI